MLACEPGRKIPFEDIIAELNGKVDDFGYGKPGWALVTDETGVGYTWRFFDVDCKVDKIPGKGLSTNDLTNDLLEYIEEAYRAIHRHGNKTVLDELDEDPTCGTLMYKGQIVSTCESCYDDSNHRPTMPSNGQMFFDSTLGIPIWWNASEWVDATGTAV